jgi:2-methylisocitrate lyase-like PEP mutase family enzyme
MATQRETYERFRALHERPGAFVIPNHWNEGATRILTALGFKALVVSSAGYAFAVGRRESTADLTRDEVFQNAAAIVGATDLPVSGDLEDRFGAVPGACAETIRRAVDVGLVGLVGRIIEDATGDPTSPLYEFPLAVERVAAASEAARDRPFMLTVRAANYLYERPDLDDTIRRLHAFADAGADVLYAPGLPSLDAIRAVCASVPKPVNVVVGLQQPLRSVDELAAAGVKRISVGSPFARVALGAFLRAALEVKEGGTFTYAADAIPDREAAAYMAESHRTEA